MSEGTRVIGSIELNINDLTGSGDGGGAGGAKGGKSPVAKQMEEIGTSVKTAMTPLKEAMRMPPRYPDPAVAKFGGAEARGAAKERESVRATAATVVKVAEGFASGGVKGLLAAGLGSFLGSTLGAALGGLIGQAIGAVVKAIGAVIEAVVDFHKFMVGEARRLANFSPEAFAATIEANRAEAKRTRTSAAWRGPSAAAALRADTYLDDQWAGLGDRLLPQLSTLTTALVYTGGLLTQMLNAIIDLGRMWTGFVTNIYAGIYNMLMDWFKGTEIGEILKAISLMFKALLTFLPGLVPNKPSADDISMSAAIKSQIANMGGQGWTTAKAVTR